MRSRSSSTFHASSTGTSTRNWSSIFTGPPAAFVRDLRACRCRPAPRCRSHSTRSTVPFAHESAGPGVAAQLAWPRRQRLRARSTGLPGRRRRRWPTGDPRPPSSAAAGARTPSAPTRGWSARPTHDRVTSSERGRAWPSTRRAGSTRCPPPTRGCRRPRRSGRATAATDLVAAVADDHEHRRRGPDAERGVERPRDERAAAPLEQRLRRVAPEARSTAAPRGSRRRRCSTGAVRAGALERDRARSPLVAFHGGAVVVPVGMLAAQRAVVVDQRLHRVGQRHDLGGAVDLDPVAVEPRRSARTATRADHVAGSSPSAAVSACADDDRPVGVDVARDRDICGGAVAPVGEHHRVVVLPDERASASSSFIAYTAWRTSSGMSKFA